MEERTSVFVWRGSLVVNHGADTGYSRVRDSCPHCGHDYRVLEDRQVIGEDGEDDTEDRYCRCPLCGFAYRYSSWSNELLMAGDQSLAVSLLKSLPLDDPDVALSELGSHLARNFSDIYAISSRKLEEVVEDVYKNLGYRTRLASPTRDGGYDLILMEGDSGRQTLVEIKKYAEHRSVGVQVVRHLLGVQVLEKVAKARIITTGRITKPAREAVSILDSAGVGYSIDLVDAEGLARALDFYNEGFPSILPLSNFGVPESKCFNPSSLLGTFTKGSAFPGKPPPLTIVETWDGCVRKHDVR